jgi:flagellar biosynthesis component FlhA
MVTVTAGEQAEVAVEVELNASLGRLFEADGQFQETLGREISRGLDGLLRTLGIPGKPSVRVAPGAEDSLFQPVRVAVGGRVCRYPRELLWQAYGYARKVQPHPAVTEVEISDWLRDSSRPDSAAAGTGLGPVAEFISFVCMEAVKIRPAVLLGSEQAAAYLTTLRDEAGGDEEAKPPDPALLIPVLRKVLNQRISVADRKTVLQTLQDESSQPRSADERGEALIAALGPDTVQILMSPQYLREITLADEGDGRPRFSWVRQHLFEQVSGLIYPRFEFSQVEGFEPGTFAFKMGHLETAPYVGLRADEALVLVPPAVLQELDIQVRGALNPLNDDLCSVIKLPAPGDEEKLKGFALWNQMEYVALTLLGELRWKPGYFCDLKTTTGLLGKLEQSYPALAKMVRHAITAERLTAVLRSLVTDDISLRHLRTIAERLLDYHYRVVSPVKFVVTEEHRRAPEPGNPADETFDDLVSLIRSGMKRFIAFRFTDNQSAFNVYVLDPGLERLLLERNSQPEEVEKVLESVRHKLNPVPVFNSRPVILTSAEARPLLRGLLLEEFPRLQVLSYNELTFNLNIEVIDKISLQGQ